MSDGTVNGLRGAVDAQLYIISKIEAVVTQISHYVDEMAELHANTFEGSSSDHVVVMVEATRKIDDDLVPIRAAIETFRNRADQYKASL